MITGLDHVVLVCADIEAGIGAYAALLGRDPDERGEAGEGLARALFRLENTGLELIGPVGEGGASDRIDALLEGAEGRLTSLVFATDDLEGARQTLARRALVPSEITGAERWRTVRLDDAACAGVKTFLLQHKALPPAPVAAAPDQVQALDHLVIETTNPDRACAHYGARLGLRLALDRRAEEWKTRFLFFRTGGLTLEIVQRLDRPDPDPASDDRFLGLTWAVAGIRAAHARLAGSGLDLSEVRTGRKPGSEVFTARSGTLGIPTLFIAHAPR